ncbi:MAG: acyl-CoA dehydrogenase family protein [bacterium]
MHSERIISEISDKEHEEFRKKVQEFAREYIAPVATKMEEKEEFPHEIIKEMGKRGWMGIPIPKKYGGAGLDNLSYAIAVEEIARVCGSTSITLAAHTSLVVWPIYTHGNEEQKKKYLIPLARGEHLGSFGLTEPNAGSDAGGTETMAIPENGYYIVNGNKRFITNGTHADTVIFTASHDRSKKTHGISAFIVEKGTPGFQPVRKEDKLGLRASDTAELSFENCKIPEKDLIGKKNEGFKVFMETLDGGRISIGALALGEAQGALDSALLYAQEKGLKRNESVQTILADMVMQISAARHLIYHAARLKDKKMTVTLEGAMAKLYASEVSMRVTSKAIDLIGMDALTNKYPVERFFRDAKLNEIGEGTSEVQRIVIARKLIGR